MYSYNKKMIKELIHKNISLSIAESCSGGELCKFFTSKPGISKIFNMGLITYSNKSKNLILKIPNSIIEKYGAVSEKIAKLMCKNLFIISNSELCISITGIAGPSGGSKNKPIGLVYICIKYKKKYFIHKKIFSGSRIKIQKKITLFTIEQIQKLI